MTLAAMLGADKDAVLCDLAETYGVYDLYQLPVMTLATLCSGLHENSRIKRKINGFNEVPAEYTLVHIADVLSMLINSIAGSKKKPELYSDYMTGKRKENKHSGFSSIDAFNAAREKIING